MSKLSMVVFATPLGFDPKENPRHIGPDAERWLAEAHNTALANSGNHIDAVWKDRMIPKDLPIIAPIFGYPESWDKARATHAGLLYYSDMIQDISKQLYYHNCGDGKWAGLDEPGSRSDIPDKAFSIGRAYQEVKDTLNLMPELKPVVTHPADKRFQEFGDRIVYAFRLDYLGYYFSVMGDDYWTGMDFPANAEIWAYLNAADLDSIDALHVWGEVGKHMRDVGATCLLINTLGGVRKHLVDAAMEPSKGLKALWRGMGDA